MQSLQGKKAIITGGARGVGKATAIALAKEGVEVGLIARTETALQSVADEINNTGGTAYYAVADVSDYNAATVAVKQLQHQLGKVDILINNAAITTYGSTVEMDPLIWENIIRVNLFGVYYITKAALPQMIENRGGDIITMSSSAAFRAKAEDGAYSASKSAVISFMEAVMNEVRQYDIRVSILAPTTIATDMAKNLGIINNIDRIVQPEDVAEFIVHQLKLPNRVFVKSVSLWGTNP